VDSSEVILRKSNRKSNPGTSCTTVSTAVSSGSHPSEPNPAQQMANAFMQVMMNAMGGNQQTFQYTRRQKAIMPTASAQGDSPKGDGGAAEPVIDKSPMDTKTPQLALEDTSNPKPNALLEVARPDPVIPPSSSKPAKQDAVPADDEPDDEFDPDKLHEAFKKPAAAKHASAKGGAKAAAKAASKSKSAAKPKSSSNKVVKDSVKKKAAKGWQVETRYRPTGQTDKFYIAPDGTIYRILKEARKNGYRE